MCNSLTIIISAILVWTDIMKSYSDVKTTTCMTTRKMNSISAYNKKHEYTKFLPDGK